MQFLFQKDGIAWKLLRDDPDRYIYEPVRQGVNIPLPKDIEAGINDVSKRDDWNKPAAPDYALPTETWREHIARRNRCLELRQKLTDGEINSINDLITYNLNIRQLAQDVIENCYDPELVWAFYQAITKITILDPTCGSGAFLFSALNILEPLYEACFEQMQMFLDENFVPQNENCIQILEKFRQILEQAHSHRNFHYFIIKSIVINNLYGVDIMQEATEICKLRLFLKLTSQVEPDVSKPNNGIEPLPDIDFNIRAGNTLVGFTSLDEVRDAITKESHGQMKLVYDSSVLDRIEEKAHAVDRSFQDFRDLQIGAQIDSNALSSKKTELRTGINQLREELDCYLADEYEMGLSKKIAAFENWKESHQPFHWIVEFYNIIKNGGFDVIIGNPPYVEWSTIKKYELLPGIYKTRNCGNLYTAICERSYKLVRNQGYVGMIVPISCIATNRMVPFRYLWKEEHLDTHASHYSGDAHPSVLFQGVKFRLSILLQRKGLLTSSLYSTHFQRWLPQERENLFQLIRYTRVEPNYIRLSLVPKVATKLHASILSKLCNSNSLVQNSIYLNSKHTVYAHRIVAHFVKAFDFIPFFKNERDGEKKSEDYKVFFTDSKLNSDTLATLLNSCLFYIWFVSYSDVYHCGREIILDFPCDINLLAKTLGKELSGVKNRLMKSLQANSVRRCIPYKATGLVEYDEFYPRISKPIINEIDQILAQYYGFTNEELDFIINYDIKYRMGQDLEKESNDG